MSILCAYSSFLRSFSYHLWMILTNRDFWARQLASLRKSIFFSSARSYLAGCMKYLMCWVYLSFPISLCRWDMNKIVVNSFNEWMDDGIDICLNTWVYYIWGKEWGYYWFYCAASYSYPARYMCSVVQWRFNLFHRSDLEWSIIFGTLSEHL